MNCRELVEFLMAYLEGELPPEQRRTFEEHLHACPPCREFLESYRDTIRLEKQALCCEDVGVDQKMPEALVQAILAASRESPGQDEAGTKRDS